MRVSCVVCVSDLQWRVPPPSRRSPSLLARRYAISPMARTAAVAEESVSVGPAVRNQSNGAYRDECVDLD